MNKKCFVYGLFALFISGNLPAMIVRFNQLKKGGCADQLLYGMQHEDDKGHRKLLIEALAARKRAEESDRKPQPLTIQVEDASNNPGFEHVIADSKDFLYKLVTHLNEFQSPNTRIINCDTRKVSWLALTLYRDCCMPQFNIRAPHLASLTFAHLLDELQELQNKANRSAQKLALLKNRFLDQNLAQHQEKIKENVAHLYEYLKKASISRGDSLMATAVELFAHELTEDPYAPVKFKDKKLTFEVLMSSNNSEEKKEIRDYFVERGGIPCLRGDIRNAIANINIPCMDIPLFDSIISQANQANALFVGDFHRKNLRAFLGSIDYQIIGQSIPPSFSLETVTLDQFFPYQLNYLAK